MVAYFSIAIVINKKINKKGSKTIAWIHFRSTWWTPTCGKDIKTIHNWSEGLKNDLSSQLQTLVKKLLSPTHSLILGMICTVISLISMIREEDASIVPNDLAIFTAEYAKMVTDFICFTINCNFCLNLGSVVDVKLCRIKILFYLQRFEKLTI